MNMFWHELKAYRKSMLVWTFSLIAVMVLFLSLYPTFAKDAEEFRQLLQGYPPAVLKALGVSFDTLFTLIGFYSYAFTYILLCSSIQAMNLGVSIVSKEVREKTADFLLTKPVSRAQIITAKLLAALTTFAVTNVIYVISASFMASVVAEETFDEKVFLMISVTAFFVGLFFMALGIFVSVVARKIKSVLSISLSTVFGFFIINLFGSVIGEEAIRYINPFKFFDTAYIMEHAAYEMKFVIIEVVFIVVAVLSSYVIYMKKDIHTV
jgi:ABC-2 type transport system permease protein